MAEIERGKLTQHHHANHPVLESRVQEGLSKAGSPSWQYMPVIPCALEAEAGESRVGGQSKPPARSYKIR